ncbi:MAG: CapA family protein [Bacteroidales bacterium]|nr:CapA family protein [Bacteroidales bacterium]
MSANIIIAGDLCLQHRTARLSFEDLCNCHSEVRQLTADADYSIVNLECSVTNDNSAKSIKKAGVALRNNDKVLDLAMFMGFDAVTLANNHFADFGQGAVEESMKLIEIRGLDHVGAGVNLYDSQKILYKTINGNQVAFINACEHEFTIATSTKGGCNPLDAISLFYNIIEAKRKAEIVIVIIHGGHEEYQLPSPRMQQMYRFFIDAGASVVVNHHQHCYSGYEVYKGCPIFYGLGNFSFDENGLRNSTWNEGCLVKLQIKDAISFELIPYIQNNDTPGISLMNNEQVKAFHDKVKMLNSIISDPKRLEEAMAEMIVRVRNKYMSPLKPYQYGPLMRIIKCHLIPKKLANKLAPVYLTPERKLLLKSYFQCESHQEVMNELLRNEK